MGGRDNGVLYLKHLVLCRLVFSRFLDLHGNLGIVKEKPTRKTCFSREKKRLAPRIYQAKFCLAEFLWIQRNLYYIFTRNMLKRGRVYLRSNYKSFIKSFIKASWRLYKSSLRLCESFIKALQKLYNTVSCLYAFKRTCWFFNNALHTFKMWLNEYFLNSWHHNCGTSMKMFRKVQMFL